MVRRGRGARAGASSTPPAAAASSDEPTPLERLRVLNRELEERDRQTARELAMNGPPALPASVLKTAEPFIEFVTEWTREHYGGTREEAFERMKRGSAPDGLSINVLGDSLWLWALPDERGLTSAMIADLGEATARRYLADIQRVLRITRQDPNAQPYHSGFPYLHLPQDVKDKYLLTVGTIRAQWEAYLQVMGREHVLDIPADQINESNALLYPSIQAHFTANVFECYRVRGLLRSGDDESQQS